MHRVASGTRLSPIFDNSGSSLLTVIVISGILIGTALFVTQAVNNVSRTNKLILQGDDFKQLIATLQLLISDSNLCTSAFGGYSFDNNQPEQPTTIPKITITDSNNSPQPIIVNSDSFLSFFISSIKFKINPNPPSVLGQSSSPTLTSPQILSAISINSGAGPIFTNRYLTWLYISAKTSPSLLTPNFAEAYLPIIIYLPSSGSSANKIYSCVGGFNTLYQSSPNAPYIDPESVSSTICSQMHGVYDATNVGFLGATLCTL
jgi:hypothetical protein